MNCDQIADHISAWIDGELEPDLAESVEEHVCTCSGCQSLVDHLRSIDVQLFSELESSRAASDKVAERVVRLLPLQQSSPHSGRWQASWRNGLALLGASAAGFLLAFVLTQRGSVNRFYAQDHDSTDPSALTGSFATVNLMTGPFQVAPLAAAEFADLDSHLLEVGSKLRTGKHKSELLTPAGAALRLDSNTELQVPAADQVILESGRIMCIALDRAADVDVRSCGTTISVEQGSYDLRCFDSKAELIALEGEIQVNGDDWQSQVKAGTKLHLADGKIVGKDRVVNPIVETSWVHDLLRKKSHDDVELLRRIDRLWASIGYSKLQSLHEDELRTLGPSCVRPLISFLTSVEQKHREVFRRRRAAKLVADLADYESVPKLIQLLHDEDLEISYQMARGLSRITGRYMIIAPEQWRGGKQAQREASARRWNDWLLKRRSHQDAI